MLTRFLILASCGIICTEKGKVQTEINATNNENSELKTRKILQENTDLMINSIARSTGQQKGPS